MACIYIYEGRVFDSELQLDDFLLANGRFIPQLGDIVFSQSDAQNSVASKLKTIENKSKSLQDKYREWRHSNEIHYTEGGEELVEQPPYIGVNKFLSGLKNQNGDLLFPEFREQAYWAKKTSEWKRGELTEEEEQIFKIKKGTLITDNNQLQNMQETIKKKWEAQAKTGTAIHSILQIFFSKDKAGKYMFNQPNLESQITSKISKKNMQYLNDKVIKDTIVYAQKLKKDLENMWCDNPGDELSFYPEFMISQDAIDIESGDPRKLFGIIDLLIVDPKGKIHILDYKTSIHDYQDFSMAKNLAYRYQLATYQRMLKIDGLNTNGGSLMVSPIKLNNFRPEGDTYAYDGISYGSTAIYIDTSLRDSEDRIEQNINEFLPYTENKIMPVSVEKLQEIVSTLMLDWFPKYSSNKIQTKEEIIEKLKKKSKNGKIEPDENGNFIYKTFGNDKPIVATTEADFIKKVVEYEQSRPSRRRRNTELVKRAIKAGIKANSSDVYFPSSNQHGGEGSPTWLQDTLKRYCNDSWQIADDEILESFGLLRLENKYSGQVDFVRISDSTLKNNYRQELESDDVFKNRSGLTGTYESDIVQQSKAISLTKVGNKTQSVQGSLMAEAINGNIEIMETMLIINQLTEMQGKVIGNIQVVNPIDANGIQLSNEQAYYCFKELVKLREKYNIESAKRVPFVNKFETGEIKLASKYELAAGMFRDIMMSGEAHEWKDDFKKFKEFQSAKSLLDQYVDSSAEDKIKALQKLLEYLTNEKNNMQASLSATYTNQRELQEKHIALYNAIHMAIIQLKGINFRQQITDHDKWLEKIMIWRHGISGTYLDNPGNLNSDTLNLVTKLVTEAYQNTRDDMQRKKIEVQKLVQNLKKSKNFGSFLENTVGNQASLYSNLYETTDEGDFLFKRPQNVADPAERALLEYALKEINSKRYPDEDQRKELVNTDDDRYYRVPLAFGGLDSTASTGTLMELLRAKLSNFKPSNAFKNARKQLEGIYEADQSTEDQQKSQLLYQMTNMFDQGSRGKEERIAKIKEIGPERLERNLETLLLKHIFAYSVKENVDSVFPMIKAAMIHITQEGAMRNTKFSSDIQYLEEYIRNKILNQSIVDPKRQGAMNVINKLKSAASKLTLAFAPVQMFYQPLQGLWNDISLMIRKPDGTDSFTFKNFTKAFKLVYSDLFTNKPTVCSLLNQIYGINDMDMNTYVDRISTAKKGIWNMENLMFKFASRPDFYNRMSIFTAQMIGDGCLDAHSVNADGELVYNWEKDARFSKFAQAVKNGNINSSDPIIVEQRARYYAMAKQFVIEHAKNKDGSLFKLDMSNPQPLPRAYTNKEAESMKSLGDDIYGYYSHEKKSMVMSTMLGSMWLQFKTYWSGKKNQYLAPGGVKIRGKWKHYEENGEKYYYQVDDKGNILYDEPPTTEETIAPVMQWEGQWQEGILVTLGDIFTAPLDAHYFNSIYKNFKSKWNDPDERLRLAYRSNLKQLFYDLIMFGIIGNFLGAILGDWLDELKEENKQNRDIMEGVKLAAANVAVLSIKNSFLDFNFFDSIGSPTVQWSPFSLEWMGRIGKLWWKVITGDEDIIDGAVKSSGGLKQIKPVLDAIKPDMFRTEREGGTFGIKEKE